MSYNPEYFYPCPCCGIENFVSIDFSADRNQTFVNDCENCCRPIVISLTLNGTEVISFNAQME